MDWAIEKRENLLGTDFDQGPVGELASYTIIEIKLMKIRLLPIKRVDLQNYQIERKIVGIKSNTILKHEKLMEKSMKIAKLILWVIIFGFITLFIFQNQTFFLTKNAFNLNFGIWEYLMPELHNGVLVLVFFCTGLIIAYLINFSARFKVKLILWVINFGFIALFIFQNQTFFLAKNAFNLNLGIWEYLMPELHNAVLVLVFFCTGIIFAHLFNFSARLKAKRKIKKPNATIAPNSKIIAGLKGETNTLKGVDTSVRSDADEMTSNSYGEDDTGESEIVER